MGLPNKFHILKEHGIESHVTILLLNFKDFNWLIQKTHLISSANRNYAVDVERGRIFSCLILAIR